MTSTDVTRPTDLALDPAAQNLLFRDARTASAFSDEAVTVEEFRAVHDLIKWGPTAMNTQPLRVVLVEPGPGRDRLVPLMSEGNRAKTVAAPLVAVLAADTRFHEHLPSIFPGRGEAVRDAMEDDAPGREATALLSTGLQIGYFIIGVRAAGLAAGPMAGFDADAVSREFFPDGDHLARVVVNIGHAGPHSYRPRNPRLEFEQVYSVV